MAVLCYGAIRNTQTPSCYLLLRILEDEVCLFTHIYLLANITCSEWECGEIAILITADSPIRIVTRWNRVIKSCGDKLQITP